MEENEKVLSIYVLETTWERIRKLCHTPHEHPDGMNECPICDKELIEDVLEKLEAWKPQHQLTEETEEDERIFKSNVAKWLKDFNRGEKMRSGEKMTALFLRDKIFTHYKLIKREK